jgi:tRNA(adenine34) deaminase
MRRRPSAVGRTNLDIGFERSAASWFLRNHEVLGASEVALLTKPNKNQTMSNHFFARDEYFMRLALREAQRAAEHGDVPIGAVVAHAGELIAAGHNERELRQDPTAHAETIALREAARALGSWRVLDAVLYVTLEPCAMCAGAIVLARIPRVVFGASDPKAGACGSVLDVLDEPRLNHRPDVASGLLAEECGALLSEFFSSRR